MRNGDQSKWGIQVSPRVWSGVFIPRKARRWIRLISPDEITRPLSETFSNIRVSLKIVTFLSVQSSNDTEYFDARSPRANWSKPWISPLHLSVCGMSQPHSKDWLFSPTFGHFHSAASLLGMFSVLSSFRLRENALLTNLLATVAWTLPICDAFDWTDLTTGKSIISLWFVCTSFEINDRFTFDAIATLKTTNRSRCSL